MGLFAGLTFLLLPMIGISATGVAFFAMYVIYVVIVWRLAVRRTGFSWSTYVKRLGLLVFASGVAIFALAWMSEWAAAGVGVVIAMGWGVYSLFRLVHASGLSGPVGRLAGALRAAMIRNGALRE